MSHPDYIEIPVGQGAATIGITGTVTCNDMQYLADQIEQMRYDKVEELLAALSKKFVRRSIADANAGKERLAQELNDVAEYLSFADASLIKAWAICRTYMREKKND